jgi:hypothetical protein
MNVDRIGAKPMAASKTAYMRLLPAAAHDLRSRCKKDAFDVKKASTQKSLRVHVKDRRTHLKHFQ